MTQLVLTERQKLAIEQELQFRRQGFQAFSSQTDPQTPGAGEQARSSGDSV